MKAAVCSLPHEHVCLNVLHRAHRPPLFSPLFVDFCSLWSLHLPFLPPPLPSTPPPPSLLPPTLYPLSNVFRVFGLTPGSEEASLLESTKTPNRWAAAAAAAARIGALVWRCTSTSDAHRACGHGTLTEALPKNFLGLSADEHGMLLVSLLLVI